MYGTQASIGTIESAEVFENDVKMYGTQATLILYHCPILFENDVKMYGTQTEQERCQCVSCLRMM